MNFAKPGKLRIHAPPNKKIVQNKGQWGTECKIWEKNIMVEALQLNARLNLAKCGVESDNYRNTNNAKYGI